MTEEQVTHPTNDVQEPQEVATNTAATDTAPTDTAAPDTERPQTPSLDDLQARIAQLEKESAEHKDNWLRAAADYRNFKRRADQERAELIRNASAGLVLKLLPVIDDMERALNSVPAEIAATSWFEGIRLIAQKLQTVLESEGVTPIEALGQDFNPHLHEAVIYEAAEDGQDGKVIAELQKGYKMRDRVLRPTMVKVGKA
jgi:molecular chaperone GrpE